MGSKQKKIAAINDLTGFGRCALTVALPVISHMRLQCCPVPTSIFSNHAGYPEYYFDDYTARLEGYLSMWRKLGLTFDGIMSGFLGSAEQIGMVEEFVGQFRSRDSVVVIDPVMGDHGKVVGTYTEEMCMQMRRLVAMADIITPNLTEACILLKQNYEFNSLTHSQAKSMLARLSELGPSKVIITGVQLATGEMANIGYDRDGGAYWYVPCDYVPVSYPGTGDIYASVLVGSLLTGDSLSMAMGRATSFVELAIKTTFSYGTDPRYGVMLESALPWLTHKEIVKNFEIL